MTERVDIESCGDHSYLVHIREGEETLLIEIRASAGVIGQLGVAESDEPRVVAATTDFLIEHQLAVDLPALIELDDVAAGYDNYLSELGDRLAATAI